MIRGSGQESRAFASASALTELVIALIDLLMALLELCRQACLSSHLHFSVRSRNFLIAASFALNDLPVALKCSPSSILASALQRAVAESPNRGNAHWIKVRVGSPAASGRSYATELNGPTLAFRWSTAKWNCH